eukprot:COSAG02_NODE_2104_length_9817_cov_8.132126_2_plen_76_part_00
MVLRGRRLRAVGVGRCEGVMMMERLGVLGLLAAVPVAGQPPHIEVGDYISGAPLSHCVLGLDRLIHGLCLAAHVS